MPLSGRGVLWVSMSVLEGKDVFAILTTGFGNSTCFLRPSAERFSFWLCPLVAIMVDQVKDAVRRGLLPQTKLSAIEGCYQLVFIGPEMLLSKGWKNVLVLLHTECFQTKLVADLLFYLILFKDIIVVIWNVWYSALCGLA